jgi:hypothetical protein
MFCTLKVVRSQHFVMEFAGSTKNHVLKRKYSKKKYVVIRSPYSLLKIYKHFLKDFELEKNKKNVAKHEI